MPRTAGPSITFIDVRACSGDGWEKQICVGIKTETTLVAKLAPAFVAKRTRTLPFQPVTHYKKWANPNFQLPKKQ